MYRPALPAAGLAACLAARLNAQTDAAARPGPVADSADVLVVDHEFTSGVGEFVRVFLQAAQVFPKSPSGPKDVTPHSDRLLFGLGWYQ